jgi:2-oxo-4-hydroxy-4-carboxy--5-ureidoimidazoline (OHCU) decarboxylase
MITATRIDNMFTPSELYSAARNKNLSKADCEKILDSSDELAINALIHNPSADSESLNRLLQKYLANTNLQEVLYPVEILAAHPNLPQEALWQLSKNRMFCEFIVKSPNLPEKLQLQIFRKMPDMHKKLAANRYLSKTVYEKLYKKHQKSGEDVYIVLTLNPSIPENIAFKLSKNNDLYKNNVIASFKNFSEIYDKVILNQKDEIYYLESILRNPYMGNDFYNKKYDEYFNRIYVDNDSFYLSRLEALGALARNSSISLSLIKDIKETSNDPHVLISLMLNNSIPLPMLEEIFLKPALGFHWSESVSVTGYKHRTKILVTNADKEIYRKLSNLFMRDELSTDFVKRCLQVETHMLVQREACLSPKASGGDVITCITSWLEEEKIGNYQLIDIKDKFAGFILDEKKQTYKTLREYILEENGIDISSMPSSMIAELLGWSE